MKSLVLLGVAAVVATAAFAEKPGHPAKKAAAAPHKKLTCPIMKGNAVNMADATKKKLYADYNGNRYFFCCPGCPAEFKKNPAKYAKAAHIPTPKPKKG